MPNLVKWKLDAENLGIKESYLVFGKQTKVYTVTSLYIEHGTDIVYVSIKRNQKQTTIHLTMTAAQNIGLFNFQSLEKFCIF